MDKKLLLEIFRIPSMSSFEERMAHYIKNKLNEFGIPYEEDEMGNIFNISHKDRPLLSSHMDTVQDVTDTLLTDFINIKGNYLSGYGVVGGDDKCGIYIILETLKNRKDINFLFSVQEEVGGLGSSGWTNGRNLDDILYGLVLDRTGNSDIICTQNNYGIKDLEIFLYEIGKDFGYSPTSGTFSDADNLNDLISCANLSVGYYNAHSKHEFVNLSDLEDSFKFVNSVITHVHEKFEGPKPKQKWYRQAKSDNFYDYDLADFNDQFITMEDIECSSCGAQKPTTYLSSINDFICYSCAQMLKSELDELTFLSEEEEQAFGW
jgi:putative aminopeptidase FrvX